MSNCNCPDPSVFGHVLNGCGQTAIPVAGYTPGPVCSDRCPHHADPLEKQAAARVEAWRRLEREAELEARWARMEAS